TTTNVNALHHLQISGSTGLNDNSSSPIVQNASGRIEFIRSSRSRYLSIGDHSWTDSRRKTTTTPAKPARATAICAAVLRASLGSTNYTSPRGGGLRKNYVAGYLSTQSTTGVTSWIVMSFSFNSQIKVFEPSR